MKVLIAEDESVSRRRLEKFLENDDYEIISCKDGIEAWEAIQSENAPHLLVLDWMMPGIDGVEICRRVRKLAEDPYTYILLLTSKDEKNDIIKGMEAGADDYITKPFDKHELEVRLKAGRRIIELNEELVKTRNILKIQATHDALTGVFNRRAILEALKLEMERSKRKKTPLSVAMLDIDFFKRVNDTYGHLVGDQILKETTRRLGSKLRTYEALGRYGGEEFLVILSDCSKGNTLGHANRLRESISETMMDSTEGMIPVTISIGVGILENVKEVDVELLIKAADEALYRAKNNGRNRVEITVVK